MEQNARGDKNYHIYFSNGIRETVISRQFICGLTDILKCKRIGMVNSECAIHGFAGKGNAQDNQDA